MGEYVFERSRVNVFLEDLLQPLNDQLNPLGIECTHKILGTEVQSTMQTDSYEVAGCVVGDEDDLHVESGGGPVSLWNGDPDFGTSHFTCPSMLDPARPDVMGATPVFFDDGQSLESESLGYNRESCRIETGALS